MAVQVFLSLNIPSIKFEWEKWNLVPGSSEGIFEVRCFSSELSEVWKYVQTYTHIKSLFGNKTNKYLALAPGK